MTNTNGGTNMNYITPKEAIDAASKLPSGEGTWLVGKEEVRYVSCGGGKVVRVEHYCNATMSGRAKVTHKERIVRSANGND